MHHTIAQVLGALLTVKQAQAAPQPSRPLPPSPDELANAKAWANIRQHENFVPTRYKDGEGIDTVGTGHNMRDRKADFRQVLGPDRTKAIYAGGAIEPNEDYRLSQDYLQRATQQMQAKVPQFNNLAPDARASLHSLYYNSPGLFGPNTQRHLNNFLATPGNDFTNNEHLRKLQHEIAYGHKAGISAKNPQGLAGLVTRRVAEANQLGAAYGLPALPAPPNPLAVKQYYNRSPLVPQPQPAPRQSSR